MNPSIFIGILLCAGVRSVHSADWSYTGKTGPRYWHELFPHACGGKNQSPIDLKVEETMYNPNLKNFAIWYDPPKPDSKMYIKNNGHAVQVDLEGDFFVTNGGLQHQYKAVQFHFHWGHKSHHGSEHLLDGQASPIEMHVVTYNQDRFSDIGEALTQPGGLAVLGVMFELSKEDNPSFDYIIRGMKHIRNPEKLAKIELPLFSLRDLLPDDISRYFRYNGSLTTPGCFETVTWTVFDKMQTISHKQMEQFRKILQFRRKHHEHKKDSPSDTRHKRELTEKEAEMEHNAKQVLSELGISGKDSEFERQALREELKHAEALQVKGTETPKGVNIVEGGDKTTMEKQEPIYVQDNIVNNFRPVQPINDRVVYRSFKLREVVVVTEYIAEVAKADAVKDNEHKAGGNGSNPVHTSLTLLIASMVLNIVKMFY